MEQVWENEPNYNNMLNLMSYMSSKVNSISILTNRLIEEPTP